MFHFLHHSSMTLKYIATALMLLVASAVANAQIEFQKSFGGAKKESFNHIISAFDHGYIAVGTTESFGAGKKDIFIVKTDSLGSLQWSKTYGGKDIDFGMYIDKSNDGNYFVTGHSASFGNQYTDVVLLKINPEGNILWGKNYNLNNSEMANHVTATPDGGCVILGETVKYLGKGKDADVMVLKIKKDGELQWSKKYGGKDLDYGYSIEITKDSGYVIGGESKSFAAGDQDMYLLKLTQNGKLEWAKAYGGKAVDYGKYAAQTSDGGYLLAGSTANFNSRDIDLCVSKVTKNGVLLWTKIYGGNNQEYISAIRILKNDDFVACGYTNSFELSNENAFIEVFNASGMPKWGKAYGADSSDLAHSISIINNKEIIMCGTTKSFGVKSEDAYMVKTFTHRTLEDCNTTDITTLVTHNVKATETNGGEESDLNMRAIDIKMSTTNCTLEEKVLCTPEEED